MKKSTRIRLMAGVSAIALATAACETEGPEREQNQVEVVEENEFDRNNINLDDKR